MEYVRINRLRGKIADYTDVSTDDDLIRINFRDEAAQIEMAKEDLELFANELAEAIETFVNQDADMNTGDDGDNDNEDGQNNDNENNDDDNNEDGE